MQGFRGQRNWSWAIPIVPVKTKEIAKSFSVWFLETCRSGAPQPKGEKLQFWKMDRSNYSFPPLALLYLGVFLSVLQRHLVQVTADPGRIPQHLAIFIFLTKWTFPPWFFAHPRQETQALPRSRRPPLYAFAVSPSGLVFFHKPCGVRMSGN